jgi:hypothetical protein
VPDITRLYACDLDAATDGTATCPEGCADAAGSEATTCAGLDADGDATPASDGASTCDLDAATDGTAACPAGCTSDAVAASCTGSQTLAGVASAEACAERCLAAEGGGGASACIGFLYAASARVAGECILASALPPFLAAPIQGGGACALKDDGSACTAGSAADCVYHPVAGAACDPPILGGGGCALKDDGSACTAGSLADCVYTPALPAACPDVARASGTECEQNRCGGTEGCSCL